MALTVSATVKLPSGKVTLAFVKLMVLLTWPPRLRLREEPLISSKLDPSVGMAIASTFRLAVVEASKRRVAPLIITKLFRLSVGVVSGVKFRDVAIWIQE